MILKTGFYDRYVEEKLIAKIQESEAKAVTGAVAMEERLITKIQESETRVTTMVGNALSQLKLELINEKLETRLQEKEK